MNRSETSNVVSLNGYKMSRKFPSDEVRIRDIEVAKKLGTSAKNLRVLIGRHAEELNDFGVLHRIGLNSTAPKGGRPDRVYWLNRGQVIVVCMLSHAKGARQVRAEISQVFKAYLDGNQAVSGSYIASVLRLDSSSEWEQMWPSGFLEAMCRLKQKSFTGRQPGPWMSRVYAFVYEVLLGEEIFAKLQELNPKPTHGKNHHQRLRADARERVAREIHTVTVLANSCSHWGDFKAKMRHAYQKAPLRLTF